MKVIKSNALVQFVLKKMNGKNWVTANNKKGKALVKEIAVAVSEKYTDEDDNFSMPIFSKVVRRTNFIEFCDKAESLEAALILKPEDDTIDFHQYDKPEAEPTQD